MTGDPGRAPGGLDGEVSTSVQEWDQSRGGEEEKAGWREGNTEHEEGTRELFRESPCKKTTVIHSITASRTSFMVEVADGMDKIL